MIFVDIVLNFVYMLIIGFKFWLIFRNILVKYCKDLKCNIIFDKKIIIMYDFLK